MSDLLQQVSEPQADSIRHIPLSQGQCAIVDAADYEWLMPYKWFLLNTRGLQYAWARVDGLAVYMHRLILSATPAEEVDHRDRSGLNNRRYNLRKCTHSQNQANRRLQSNNTTGFRGVYWDKARAQWSAEIKVMGKKRFLGRYASIEEAAAVRDEASKIHFGEFAQLNSPYPPKNPTDPCPVIDE